MCPVGAGRFLSTPPGPHRYPAECALRGHQIYGGPASRRY